MSNLSKKLREACLLRPGNRTERIGADRKDLAKRD